MKCEAADTDALSEEDEEPESPSLASPLPQKKPMSTARLLRTKINLTRIVINVSDTQYPVVSEVAEDLDWKVQTKADSGDWDVFWTDCAVLPEILFRMHFFQKINHYPGIHIIARKNLLGLSLMGMRDKFPKEYDFFPLTWMLPSQYHEFRRYYESVQKGKTRTYIVKPEADCQGRGIFLTRSIEEVMNGNHYVVQKYVHHPFLLEGLKFDFRIYVLLAGTQPLRVYLYDEGLVRLATHPYHQPMPGNMANMCMHLTNYAINKNNPNFVFNTSDKNMGTGHKRALSVVLSQLEKQGHDIAGLKEKIKDIVIKTLLTGMPLIAHQYRYCQPEEYSGNMCFHILGLDIMLTNRLEPILLEVNHTPSFTTDTPLDQHIKYKLIKDTLVLMNINIEKKKELFQKAKECNSERLFTGKRRIFSGKDKQQQILKAQEGRNKYERQHMGGYELIHPSNDPELNAKYESLLVHARKLYAEGTTRNKSMKEEKTKPHLSTLSTNKVQSHQQRPSSQDKVRGLNTITGVRKDSDMRMTANLFPRRMIQKVCNHVVLGDFLERKRSSGERVSGVTQPIPRMQRKPPRKCTEELKSEKRNVVITSSVDSRHVAHLQQLHIDQLRLSRNNFGNFLQPKIYDLNQQQQQLNKQQQELGQATFGNSSSMALSVRYQRSKRASVSRIKHELQKKLRLDQQYR